MIGRYKIGPRRVVIAAVIQVPGKDGGITDVTIADPAIDLAKSNLAEYKESLYDEKHLAYFEGEKPSYFTIQPLTRRQKDAADGMSPRQTAAFFIRCAVTAIDGYQIQDAGGAVVDAPQPKRKDNGSLGAMAQESWVDKLDMPTDFLFALSYMIRTISEASPPLSRPSELPAGLTE